MQCFTPNSDLSFGLLVTFHRMDNLIKTSFESTPASLVLNSRLSHWFIIVDPRGGPPQPLRAKDASNIPTRGWVTSDCMKSTYRFSPTSLLTLPSMQ